MQRPRKRKTETRLSSLLERIRKKPNKIDKASTKRTRKVHFKWKRFDAFKYDYTIVSYRSGGGYRFVSVGDKDIELESLKSKAIDLFLPNGINYFGENVNQCNIILTDSSGNALQNQTLSAYLKMTGFYLSRMYFVIQSECSYII